MKAAATSTFTAAPPTVKETGASVPTAFGAAAATFTEIERVADPLALRAVKSTEALPGPTGVRVTTLPFTSAATTPVLRERASTGTPAGVKACARSTSTAAPPADRETGANVPTARGAAAATVTRIVRLVDPLALCAVTSTEVLPDATGIRVSDGPSPTDAVTTRSLRDRAVTWKPAGEKAFRRSTTSGGAPMVSDTGRMVPEALGGPTTSTWSCREPVPKLFEAVTSIVVLPAPAGVTLSAVSAWTDTVATPGFSERASRRKPLGVKAAPTSTKAGPDPVPSIKGGSVPAGAGAVAWFSPTTITGIPRVALPAALCAVTVIAVVPGAKGVTVSSRPATAAVAISSSSEVAWKESPVGGLNAVERSITVGVLPATSASGSRLPVVAGRATTVTSSVRVSDPVALCAVISMAPLPGETGVRMAVVPDTDAVTIPGFSVRTVRVKPGGEKAPAKSTGTGPSPRLRVTGCKAPATVGGAVAPCGTTRTVNVVSATPPAFPAVTVISAVPALTGATSALPPSRADTTATFVLDEVADHSLTTPENACEKSTTASGPRTVNSRSGS